MPAESALTAPFTAGRAGFEDAAARFAAVLAQAPQTEIPVRHFFVAGMVLRQMYAPAGTLIVGWVHKKPSFAVVSSGAIAVANRDGRAVLKAGDVFVCEPGTQNIGYAVEDTTFLNVWRTELSPEGLSDEDIDAAVRADVATAPVWPAFNPAEEPCQLQA